MQITDENIQIVKRKYDAIADCLTEKGRRLWSASEAISYGYGDENEYKCSKKNLR